MQLDGQPVATQLSAVPITRAEFLSVPLLKESGYTHSVYSYVRREDFLLLGAEVEAFTQGALVLRRDVLATDPLACLNALTQRREALLLHINAECDQEVDRAQHAWARGDTLSDTHADGAFALRLQAAEAALDVFDRQYPEVLAHVDAQQARALDRFLDPD